MSDKTSPKGGDSKSDDLDLLLDSALDDFDKPLPSVTLPNPDAKPDQKPLNAESNEWTNEFKQFQDAMQAFLGSDEASQKEYEQFSQEAGSSISSDFSSSLANTLKTIADNAHSIPEPTPEELSMFMNSLGIEEGGAIGNKELPDFLPLMENVMQSLLSKELLYPALKEIVVKYPQWLAEKQGSIEEEEFKKYACQYELMQQACDEFEKADSTPQSKESFEKILTLMQQMQEYGNPPKELMGDMTLDPQGNIKIPGMPEQCKLM